MSQHDHGDENHGSSPPRRAPRSFTDESGRSIEIRTGCPRAGLVEMYDDYDSECRSQGLPPVGRDRIDEWLDVLEDGVNVVAWYCPAETEPRSSHDIAEPAGQTGREIAVGHACLLGGAEGPAELAIFVHQDFQLAGIGSRLLGTLLGEGRASGVETVWLTVERSNHVAITLYRSVGFETTNVGGVEHEMELDL